jgi:hypothetical protein
MCPLLAQLEIGFFSSFSATAVYSTNEANKAGLKQSIIFRCLWRKRWQTASGCDSHNNHEEFFFFFENSDKNLKDKVIFEESVFSWEIFFLKMSRK